jgi:hypothetical protein
MCPAPVKTPSRFPQHNAALNVQLEEFAIDGNTEHKAISRWPTVKRTVKHTTTAAGVAMQVAQPITGTTAVALLTASAAASATGIGLVVTGAAVTLGSMIASARSAYKTSHHIDALRKIHDRADSLACNMITPDGGRAYFNPVQHGEVKAALEYLLNKKSAKLKKKVAGAVGGGLLTAIYGVGKAAYKSLQGTKGVNRMRQAEIIAVHFVTHNCALAQAIVAELYSAEEMLFLLDKDSDVVAKFLAEKMKST